MTVLIIPVFLLPISSPVIGRNRRRGKETLSEAQEYEAERQREVEETKETA